MDYARMKTGDAIATVAQPIARGIDYLFGTDIEHCSGCKRMQNNLNAGMSFAGAIYDRFWHSDNNNKETTIMDEEIQFQIIVAVKAKSVEDALARYKTEGATISVTPRPQPPLQRQQPQQTLTGKPA